MARIGSELCQEEQEAGQVGGAVLPWAPLCERRTSQKGTLPSPQRPWLRETEHPCLPKPVHGLDRKLRQPGAW